MFTRGAAFQELQRSHISCCGRSHVKERKSEREREREKGGERAIEQMTEVCLCCQAVANSILQTASISSQSKQSSVTFSGKLLPLRWRECLSLQSGEVLGGSFKACVGVGELGFS